MQPDRPIFPSVRDFLRGKSQAPTDRVVGSHVRLATYFANLRHWKTKEIKVFIFANVFFSSFTKVRRKVQDLISKKRKKERFLEIVNIVQAKLTSGYQDFLDIPFEEIKVKAGSRSVNCAISSLNLPDISDISINALSSSTAATESR